MRDEKGIVSLDFELTGSLTRPIPMPKFQKTVQRVIDTEKAKVQQKAQEAVDTKKTELKQEVDKKAEELKREAEEKLKNLFK